MASRHRDCRPAAGQTRPGGGEKKKKEEKIEYFDLCRYFCYKEAYKVDKNVITKLFLECKKFKQSEPSLSKKLDKSRRSRR